jgi:DNA-binding MarR family transcriptional regulator
MITKKRRADNGGHLEHQTKFFTKDLACSLNFARSTARRIMKELEVLGIVKITKETIPNGKGKRGDCITLVDKFQWLLEGQFQNLIKDFDWDALTAGSEEEEDEVENQPKPMHRAYDGSDIWECDYCKIRGDRHFIESHPQL